METKQVRRPTTDPRPNRAGLPLSSGRRRTAASMAGWSNDALIGDPVIDRQHKEFYVRALRVVVACELGKGAPQIAATLQFMREHADRHFADEEQRMRDVEFPYIELHREAHDRFRSRVRQLEGDFTASHDPETLAREVADVASEWFTDHIRRFDVLLGRYLNT